MALPPILNSVSAQAQRQPVKDIEEDGGVSAIENDPGWYERMARRTTARRMVAEAEDYANNPPVPIHLHGTMTVCPCGAETGVTTVAASVTTVASGEDYRPPNFCPECGKPKDRWCDTQPWRTDIDNHDYGCRANPDVPRCTFCNEPMIGGAVYDGRGQYHFGCSPGAQTWDPDLGKWRDRDGNLSDDPSEEE